MSTTAPDAPTEQEFGPGFLQLARNINNTHRGALAGDAQAAEMCTSFLAEVKDKLGERFPVFLERHCPDVTLAWAEDRLAARERTNAPSPAQNAEDVAATKPVPTVSVKAAHHHISYPAAVLWNAREARETTYRVPVPAIVFEEPEPAATQPGPEPIAAAAATETLDYHPLADLFPLIEGTEFDDLVADIQANGLNDPVMLFEGKILDGRNRYRACIAAGIEPRTLRFEYYLGKIKSPLAYVISSNLKRRHLDEGQRAAVASKIANLEHGGDRRSTDQAANLQDETERRPAPPPISMAAAAKMFNVSGRTVASAKVVQDKGVPALNQAVVQGKLSVSAAAKATKLDPATQERVAALAMEGNVKQARKVIADEIAEGEAPRGVEPEAEVVDDGEPIAGTGSISRDSAEMLKKARNEALFGLQMEISERLLQTSGHRSYDDGNIGKMLVFAKIAINSCPDVDWDDWLREGFSKLGCGLSIDDPVSMAERFMDIYRSGKQPARTGEYAALSLSMIVRILAGDFNSAAWSDASLLAAPFASIG